MRCRVAGLEPDVSNRSGYCAPCSTRGSIVMSRWGTVSTARIGRERVTPAPVRCPHGPVGPGGGRSDADHAGCYQFVAMYWVSQNS